MSLQVDESGRRARSRSRDRSRTRPDIVDAVPYPSSTDALRDPSSTAFEYERLSKYDDNDDEYYRRRREDRDRERDRDRDRDRDRERDRERQRDRDRDSDKEREELQRASMFLPSKYAKMSGANGKGDESSSPRDSRDSLRKQEKERERERKKEKIEEDLAYGKTPGPSRYDAPGRPESPPAATYVYAQPKPYEYAKVDDPRYSNGRLDVGPRPSGRDPSPGPVKSAMKRGTSPQPPVGRMASLTVNTGHHQASVGMSLSAAPPSPLLESYQGTYQQLSPMPSPLLLPARTSNSDIVEAISPIGDDDDRRRPRRARFHDPVDDAARLAKALKGEKRAPETEPLIEILPGLTHEQVMELRVEYKRLVKTGSDRRGVNIAKHIRARLKDEDPNLMKACYATALGRWESEAYWANFWYHGDKTRRELLIEALMGRTNDEIRRIKDGFSDKKYGDSLTRCMRTELKEDKFKKAVLLVLEERRMEETDTYGRPLRIDHDLVYDDVKELGYAVRSEKGGETLMINIVTQRSDSHLREVLKVYKEVYKGANFAKDALRKSGNLVVCFPPYIYAPHAYR